jgi:Ca2+-binding RTX toxin-like protein
MSTSKDLSSLVDSLQAKAAAKPAKAAIYQAKLDAKIAAIIAKGKTVVIDGATVTSYDLDTGGSSGGGSSGSGTTGTTYDLSTGLDNKVGTANNDTFNAPNAAGTAAGQTFTVADTVVGGNGTDTLNAVIGAASTYAASNVSGVEIINGTFTAAGTISLLGSSGVTNANGNGSTAAATFTNIASTSVGLGVYNTDQNHTFTFTAAAVAGAADSTTLTVSNATAGTVTVANVETINVVSTGGANALTALTAAAATTLNFSGDTTLNLGAANTVATTITSTNTAGITLTSDVATAVTMSGGAGNDAITLAETAAASNSVNGGAGNDTITFTQNLDTGDTVVGGDGTDTVVAVSADATASYTNISGVERIQVSDALAAGLTTANFQAGIERVNLADQTGGQTITFEAGSKTLALAVAAGAAIVVGDTGTATNDALTLLNTSAGTDVYDAQNLTVTGFETVTVSTDTTTTRASNDLGAISITPDSGGAVALNFVGNNAVTTTGITISSATAGVVNASGLTGTATFNDGGNAATGVTSITGSANGDRITGSATATTIDGGAGSDTLTGGALADVIVGGTGNDTIDGAAGNDSVTGGDGNDSITSGTGNDTIDAGSGNDTIVFGANLATGDSINGGDGTDTLSVTSAGTLATLAGYSLSAVNALNERISNIERVLVTDTINLGAAFDMSRLDSISYLRLTAAAGTITGDEEISGLANNSTVQVDVDPNATTDVLTLTLADNTGASDTLNFVMQQAASDDYGVLSVAGVETLNITANEATASATVNTAQLGLTISRSDGTNTRAVTVNFLGTEAITVDTAIGADTINASSMTAAFIMTDTTGSAIAQTITSGSGADSIYGGGGADTIDSGSGGDSIVAGTGADVITGGAGADTILGGAGNDSVILTESNASSDTVWLNWSGATDIDSIVGFTTGSTNGDVIAFDVSELVKVSTSGGVHSTATVLANLDDAGAPGTTEGVQIMTAAAAAAADANIFVLSGTSFSTTGEVEDALEVGGSRALSTVSATIDAQDLFFVVYTDGSDTYVAAARVTIDDDGGTFDAGSLSIVNLAKLVGVSSIGSTTFVAGNFDFV